MDPTPMAHLVPELKIRILSHLDTPAALSHLGQSCRAWYEVANEELYKRDARENNSFAIKWMAVHAVNEHTTDSALRTLEVSRHWGGQINAVQPEPPTQHIGRMMYDSSTALNIAVALGNVRLAEILLDMGARHDIPCSAVVWQLGRSQEFNSRLAYFQVVFKRYFNFGPVLPIFVAFMKGDSQMCRLLVERGVGRDAMIVESDFGTTLRISVLHFVAADPTIYYNEWRFFYDRFREHINEPCTAMNLTPLHVAMMSGSDQGLHNALETGADREAINSAMQTPRMMGAQGFLDLLDM